MILLITLNFTVFVFSTVHVTIIHIESTLKKKKNNSSFSKRQCLKFVRLSLRRVS